jgi:hypothetical protein
MSEGNIPSKDPADEGSLGGVLRSVFRKLLMNTDAMLPARVLNYDRENNVATVQPVIAMLTTDGKVVPRAQVARVPVLALGGGGFCLNFPLVQGDLGWIEASDRDISLYLQSLNEAQPNTYRLHSFEDGRFIPDVMNKFDVGDVAADEMAIQSLDGTVRVTLSPTRVRVVAPEVLIDTDQMTVNGVTTFNDEVTFNDDTVTNGIRFSTHKHTGVTTGGGTSGGPTS